MKEERGRTREYAKDRGYEQTVERLNRLLAGAAVPPSPPARPVLFIAGLPRSGTTLLYQLVAAGGGFGYPSNFVARFYRRPAAGALAQALAAPWLPRPEPSFSSRAGATPGWSEPHEFGYFWEGHFPFAEHHEPGKEALGRLDLTLLVGLLGELEETLGLALAFKNVILSFVLDRLARDLPTARVVRIRRPYVDVALSLVAVRRAYFGSAEAWFSVRPAGAAEMLRRPAAEQIAFQIARVEAALDDARNALEPDRWLEIEYATLCTDPRAALTRVAAFAGVDPAALDLGGVPERFVPRHRGGGDSTEARELARALAAAGLAEGDPSR